MGHMVIPGVRCIEIRSLEFYLRFHLSDHAKEAAKAAISCGSPNTSFPVSANSPANIIPVGPPPAITTACLLIASLQPMPCLHKHHHVSPYGRSIAGSRGIQFLETPRFTCSPKASQYKSPHLRHRQRMSRRTPLPYRSRRRSSFHSMCRATYRYCS